MGRAPSLTMGILGFMLLVRLNMLDSGAFGYCERLHYQWYLIFRLQFREQWIQALPGGMQSLHLPYRPSFGSPELFIMVTCGPIVMKFAGYEMSRAF